MLSSRAAHGAAQPEDLAQGLLRIVLDELSGGVYIPNPATLDRLLRDHHIRQTFTGRNHAQLAATHGLTPRQIRKILHQR